MKWVCSWYVAAGSKTGDVFISIHEFVVTNNRPPWFESIPYTCWRHHTLYRQLKFSIQTLLEELFCMTTLNLECPKIYTTVANYLFLTNRTLETLEVLTIDDWKALKYIVYLGRSKPLWINCFLALGLQILEFYKLALGIHIAAVLWISK